MRRIKVRRENSNWYFFLCLQSPEFRYKLTSACGTKLLIFLRFMMMALKRFRRIAIITRQTVSSWKFVSMLEKSEKSWQWNEIRLETLSIFQSQSLQQDSIKYLKHVARVCWSQLNFFHFSYKLKLQIYNSKRSWWFFPLAHDAR